MSEKIKTWLKSYGEEMKSAKAKIELANKDLKDARKDIGVILKGVKGLGIRAEGEASTTTTVQ